MKFSDYTPSELIGKRVLYESGMTYDNHKSRRITFITSVTKKGFKINKTNKLFSFNNGRQYGLTRKEDAAIVSVCRLLTDKEADALIKEWNEKKERASIISLITGNIEKIDIEKLRVIQSLLINK